MAIAQGLKTLLKDLCVELRKEKLQFCLAGGWAVSILGVARTTIDIDLLVVLDEGTKKQILAILQNSFNLIQSHDDEMEFKNITIWRNIVAGKDQDEHFMINLLKGQN